jgi:hypothetical protein
MSLTEKIFSRWKTAIAVILVFLTAGCGDGKGPRTFPVDGQILVDRGPLRVDKATVVFKANANKGNKTSFEPVGDVDPDGKYHLVTGSKNGAPPGWYRVIVVAYDEPEAGKSLPHRPANYKLRVNRKYSSEKTSTLEIEVVESPAPGAYDLHLTQ